MEGKFDVIITDKLCKQCGIFDLALCPKQAFDRATGLSGSCPSEDCIGRKTVSDKAVLILL